MNIAILIPCFNEAIAIEKVIADFKNALPQASIYVYDNNSTDGTGAVAQRTGVIVRQELRQGKGHVVCRMFSDIEADLYVLVDGDGTYDAKDAHRFVSVMIEQQLDFINGKRMESDHANYRSGHRFGNLLLTGLVSFIFANRLRDMLSGYKIFSRRFVKSFPKLSVGFEIETQLVVHALQMNMPMIEMPTKYFNRAEGSASKLSTFKDGFRILKTIFKLLISEKPILFFSTIGSIIFVTDLLLGFPIVLNYFQSGLVPRLPTWTGIVGLLIISMLSFITGILLHAITENRKEARRLAYLSIPHLATHTRS